MQPIKDYSFKSLGNSGNQADFEPNDLDIDLNYLLHRQNETSQRLNDLDVSMVSLQQELAVLNNLTNQGNYQNNGSMPNYEAGYSNAHDNAAEYSYPPESFAANKPGKNLEDNVLVNAASEAMTRFIKKNIIILVAGLFTANTGAEFISYSQLRSDQLESTEQLNTQLKENTNKIQNQVNVKTEAIKRNTVQIKQDLQQVEKQTEAIIEAESEGALEDLRQENNLLKLKVDPKSNF